MVYHTYNEILMYPMVVFSILLAMILIGLLVIKMFDN